MGVLDYKPSPRKNAIHKSPSTQRTFKPHEDDTAAALFFSCNLKVAFWWALLFPFEVKVSLTALQEVSVVVLCRMENFTAWLFLTGHVWPWADI